MAQPDYIVIGAGTVGVSLAYGLQKRGQSVCVVDGGARDFRAARANFGLVWVQGKGGNLPAYARWTAESAVLWPGFRDALEQSSGIGLDYQKPGGLVFSLSEQALRDRRAMLEVIGGGALPEGVEMLDRGALQARLPDAPLGPDVAGASYGASDGHVNPLKLLAALQQGVLQLGGEILWDWPVQTLRTNDQGYELTGPNGATLRAPKVIVAAGLATSGIVAPLGIDLPLRPQRGQLLVTERMAPMLPMPCSGLRQTADGTVMIGATHEDVGLDTSTTQGSATILAERALRILPALSGARIVRQWSGLRVLSPDGGPLYTQPKAYPGLWTVSCHSGVTLAAVHAERLAEQILAGALTGDTRHFSKDRFHVPTPA